MRKELVLALALAGSALTPAVAQDKPQAAAPTAQPATSSAGRQVPLKGQITLSRFMGEKKISSTPYMLGVLSNSQKTSLRMGVQVPVTPTVYGPKDGPASIPQSSYSYRDVGTNIDCQAQDVGNGLFSLVIMLDDSTIHLDKSPESAEE